MATPVSAPATRGQHEPPAGPRRPPPPPRRPAALRGARRATTSGRHGSFPRGVGGSGSFHCHGTFLHLNQLPQLPQPGLSPAPRQGQPLAGQPGPARPPAHRGPRSRPRLHQTGPTTGASGLLPAPSPTLRGSPATHTAAQRTHQRTHQRTPEGARRSVQGEVGGAARAEKVDPCVASARAAGKGGVDFPQPRPGTPLQTSHGEPSTLTLCSPLPGAPPLRLHLKEASSTLS